MVQGDRVPRKPNTGLPDLLKCWFHQWLQDGGAQEPFIIAMKLSFSLSYEIILELVNLTFFNAVLNLTFSSVSWRSFHIKPGRATLTFYSAAQYPITQMCQSLFYQSLLLNSFHDFKQCSSEKLCTLIIS